MPLCKETWLISLLLKGNISSHPCLVVNYPCNPNAPPWNSSGPDRILLLACGHCPGYYVCTEDGEEIYARENLLFSSSVSSFLHGQHTCSCTYKANSLLQLELIAFLLMISEEMPEVEQASSFPQTAMLKNQGEEAALYLSTKQDVILLYILNIQTQIFPPWEPAEITHM